MRNMVWYYQQALTEDKQRMAELYARKYHEFEDAARRFQERARDEKDVALVQQALAHQQALQQQVQFAVKENSRILEEEAERRVVSVERTAEAAAIDFEQRALQYVEQQKDTVGKAEADALAKAQAREKEHWSLCKSEESRALQADLREQNLKAELAAKDLHSEQIAAAMAAFRSQCERKLQSEQQQFLLESAKLKAERDAAVRQKELVEQQHKDARGAAASSCESRVLPYQPAFSVQESMAASAKSGTTQSFTIVGRSTAPGATDVSNEAPLTAADPSLLSPSAEDPMALQIKELQKKLQALQAEYQDADIERRRLATPEVLRGGLSHISGQDNTAGSTAVMSHPQPINKPIIFPMTPNEKESQPINKSMIFPVTQTDKESHDSGRAEAQAVPRGAAPNDVTTASLKVPCLANMTSEQKEAAQGGLGSLVAPQPTVFGVANGWPTHELPYWIEQKNQPEMRSSLALTPSSQQLGSDDRAGTPPPGVSDVTQMLLKMQKADGNPIDITFSKTPNPAEQRGWLDALKKKCARGQRDPGEVMRWLTVCECSDNVPEDFGTAGQYYSPKYAEMEAKILEGLRKVLTSKIRHELESYEKKWVSQEPYQLVTGRLAIKLIILNNKIMITMIKYNNF